MVSSIGRVSDLSRPEIAGSIIKRGLISLRRALCLMAICLSTLILKSLNQFYIHVYIKLGTYLIFYHDS